jgi:hypothetical protein
VSRPTTSATERPASSSCRHGVRRFRPSDRNAYLRLFDRVRGGDPSPEWFEWKFEDNPYLDHVPLFVADREDDLIAAVAMWPLRVRLGDEVGVAVQPCDAVVDPDHRATGVLADVLGEAFETYRSGDPSICFDFDDGSGMTPRASDRQSVADLPTYYRIQNPAPLLDGVAALGAAADAVARGYLAACDKIAPAVPSLSVDWFDGVPAETFAELYRRQVPEAIHALRDERFYRWRFENPRREYEAYVVRRDGSAVAGAIVGAPSDDRTDHNTVRIVDLVPMLGNDDHAASLLDAVVSARSDADVIAAHPHVASHRVLSRFGFHRVDAFPLSRICDPTDFGVYPLTPEGATVGVHNGFDPTDRSDWLTTFCEHSGA